MIYHFVAKAKSSEFMPVRFENGKAVMGYAVGCNARQIFLMQVLCY
jgi:hypothetical protein